MDGDDLIPVDGDAAIPIDPDLAPTDPAEPAIGRPHPSRAVPRAQADVLAVIALGGMLGASARYGIARWLPVTSGRFPWPTFWANTSGSFLLGFLLVVVLVRFPTSRYLRPFVATGILGAYTTMSTYAAETSLLVRDGHAAMAVAYAVVSVAVGLAVAVVGMACGRRVAA